MMARHMNSLSVSSPQRPVAPSWDTTLEDRGGCEGGVKRGSREKKEKVEKIIPVLRFLD